MTAVVHRCPNGLLIDPFVVYGDAVADEAGCRVSVSAAALPPVGEYAGTWARPGEEPAAVLLAVQPRLLPWAASQAEVKVTVLDGGEPPTGRVRVAFVGYVRDEVAESATKADVARALVAAAVAA